MNQLDYLAKPPIIQPISKIIIPETICYKSGHDIPIYEIRKKGCGVVLIDLVFQAGRPQEGVKLVASCCAALLREGAGPYSSEVLSEQIDYMGATLQTRASHDYIIIKAVCLKSQLADLMTIIGAIVNKPHFSQLEWSQYKERVKERLKIQLAKSDILSYRTLTEAVYGADHPYGYNSSPSYYDAITIEDLRRHHEDFITASNCQIFIAGDICDDDRGLFDRLCSNIPEGGKMGHEVILPKITSSPQNIFVKGRMNQTSIRLGRLACKRSDDDFDGINFLCTLLGGYFGSRLVTRIREEKGLTYNIYCTADSQLYEGDIMISTEVANENVDLCVEEIFSEMEILRHLLVGDEELALVKNYMMGNYLNLFDGPFNSMKAIKSLALAQIPLDKLDSLIKSSLAFDAHNVRDMARKYFNRNDFWKVIVGIPQGD